MSAKERRQLHITNGLLFPDLLNKILDGIQDRQNSTIEQLPLLGLAERSKIFSDVYSASTLLLKHVARSVIRALD